MVVLLAVLAGWGCTNVEMGLVDVYDGRELCKIENPSIHESSGLAYSSINPQVLWTHNDSGDVARIFAFDLEGRDLGTFNIDEAEAVDWEDMDSFVMNGEAYLLIADVGDNFRQRESVTIYVIREPEVNPQHQKHRGIIELERRIDFRYEDGPVDCEAVAMDPETLSIFLVAKTRAGRADIYSLEWQDVVPGEVATVEIVASASIAQATAMDISPDAQRAVVLTYVNAYMFTRAPGQSWDQAFAGKPETMQMPRRQQGESICFGPDGTKLYLTTEYAPSPLWEVNASPSNP